MKTMIGSAAGLLAAFLLASCASAPAVDLTEPRRLLGRENDVRLDAQVFAERLSPGGTVRIVWEVTNERPEPIAIAELIPETTFEPETATLTVHLGSEVPGNQYLPRLIQLSAGEKHSQSIAAKIPVIRQASGARAIPRQLRVRLIYLEETEPFRELIGIPERAIEDSERADALFEQWVEATRTVETNALPIDWNGAGALDNVNAGRRSP